MRGEIMKSARRFVRLDTDDAPLAGYVVAGFYADGGTRVAFQYDPDKCPVPKVLFPTWVEEVLRRDVITETEARSVFDEMFEWQDK